MVVRRRTKLRIEVQEGYNFRDSGRTRWAVLDIHVINEGERDEQKQPHRVHRIRVTTGRGQEFMSPTQSPLSMKDFSV